MIPWFTALQIGVALLAGVVCFGAALLQKRPNDITLGSLTIVFLGLVVQIGVAIVTPLVGNPPVGDPLEYWMYLVVAVVLPPAAVLWALIDKSVAANTVVGITACTVAIMVYRMQVIWG